MTDKQEAQYFATVLEMRSVPEGKIDNFCEDLRLWLHMHKQVDEIKESLGPLAHTLELKARDDAFGWLDDNKHDGRIRIELHTADASVESKVHGH